MKLLHTPEEVNDLMEEYTRKLMPYPAELTEHQLNQTSQQLKSLRNRLETATTENTIIPNTRPYPKKTLDATYGLFLKSGEEITVPQTTQNVIT